MGDVHRRLIAFDLDGTLVDSRQDLADSANQLIAELGGATLSTDAIASMVGEGAAVLVRRALAAAHLPESAEALARFLSIYDQRLLNYTALYPGIGEVLTAARACAHLAVLTNKPLAPTERILTGLGVRDTFAHVIGGDGSHPRKPDPSGLLALMGITGCSPQSTLLVGDTEIDRQTAQRANARCCLVTFGFGRALAPAGVGEWLVDDAAGIVQAMRHFADA